MPDENKCREYLANERWPDGKVICPYCGGGNIYRISDRDRYKCGNSSCYKKFSVTVGTVFEASKIPLSKWLVAVYMSTAHKKGISSYQLGRDIKVSQKTAWFMLHRIREMMRPKEQTKLDNIVEADEVYLGGSITNKHYGIRKQIAANGEWKSTKLTALGMIERGGELKLQVIEPNKPNLIPDTVRENLEFAATLVTDDFNAYQSLNDTFYHFTVNHSKNEFVRLHFHTNSIEGAFSHLKRMIYGIYHQISTQHTHRYLDEFIYRFNSRKITDCERFTMSLKRIEGRLDYKTLISATKPENRYKKASKVYRRKAVVKRQDDEIIGEYLSMSQAARENKISLSHLHYAIKNGRKAGGYFWDFA